jgi:hypothetical protein
MSTSMIEVGCPANIMYQGNHRQGRKPFIPPLLRLLRPFLILDEVLMALFRLTV